MFWRYNEWQKNEALNGMNYQEGWNRCTLELGLGGTDFKQFIEIVFSGENRLVEKHKKLHMPSG